MPCEHGAMADAHTFDGAYACECDNATFIGENCEEKVVGSGSAGSRNDGDSVIVLSVLLPTILAICVLVVAGMKYQRYTTSMLATDFFEQLQAMKDRGEVDATQASKSGVPRELKRRWLALVDKLGHGQFGDVWKGLLKDGGNPSIPEYMVACKVVKEASGGLDTAGFAAAEEDLLKEALLMAQVETHDNLVSLVGVITRGTPKILVLSFCEHGELLGQLKKRCANGKPFDQVSKFRFCAEVAAGMQHLCAHGFVHRDLAARNVLLATGMVCKIADFGLSRQVQTEDNASDYYRSSTGIVPVRWTAPEGLMNQKFSSAGDVWSFGITCIEIFQDGDRPYAAEGSNPAVINLVAAGRVHPRPRGCTPQVHAILVKCWAFEPKHRPEFPALAAFFAKLAIAAEAAGSSARVGVLPTHVDRSSPSARQNSGYDLGGSSTHNVYDLDSAEQNDGYDLGGGVEFGAAERALLQTTAYAARHGGSWPHAHGPHGEYQRCTFPRHAHAHTERGAQRFATQTHFHLSHPLLRRQYSCVDAAWRSSCVGAC